MEIKMNNTLEQLMCATVIIVGLMGAVILVMVLLSKAPIDGNAHWQSDSKYQEVEKEKTKESFVGVIGGKIIAVDQAVGTAIFGKEVK
jgi:hypothetical protein